MGARAIRGAFPLHPRVSSVGETHQNGARTGWDIEDVFRRFVLAYDSLSATTVPFFVQGTVVLQNDVCTVFYFVVYIRGKDSFFG